MSLDGGNMKLCHYFESMAICFYVLLPLFSSMGAITHDRGLIPVEIQIV
jgi:hypothetical protein